MSVSGGFAKCCSTSETLHMALSVTDHIKNTASYPLLSVGTADWRFCHTSSTHQLQVFSRTSGLEHMKKTVKCKEFNTEIIDCGKLKLSVKLGENLTLRNDELGWVPFTVLSVELVPY
jgi:hypothetical protein